MAQLPERQAWNEASHSLELLHALLDERSAELRRLTEQLAAARREYEADRGARLQEVNEQLVLSALNAQTIADSAASRLIELARASQRDALTDTPNRSLMLDRLEHAISGARRHSTRLALLFVDLDNFKEINDTLGHSIGDAALQLVARRLESVVRDSDTVSRYGGDEFLVLLAEVAHAADAVLIAGKLQDAVAQPEVMAGTVLQLSASVGIAVYPDDGQDAATLIAHADAAMYRSKAVRRSPKGVAQGRDATPVGTAPMMADATPDSPQSAVAGRASRHTPSDHVHDLQEANEHLTVAALAARELEAQAREAHRRQSQALAMVAHEMRNPLTPIRTAAELLTHIGTDASLALRVQAILRRQVGYMSRLVEDLLDGSRAQSDKFSLERGPVDIVAVLHAAAESARPSTELRHQHLFVDLPPSGALVVQGDAVRLSQIFVNLLDNASKYTPKGNAIRLTASARAEDITITVSDNGLGISAQALPHVFDLFMQEADPHALDQHGLGIGLAVVRTLAEAHGGTVVARSEGKGKGSQFVVTLPLALPPASQ